MYILFDKNTKVVIKITNKKPAAATDNVNIAETDNIPEKYDYLIVKDEKLQTRTWTEKQTKVINNVETIVDIEKSEQYITCNLMAQVKPQPTLEEIERQKEIEYKELCEKYIRQKYSVSDEFEVLRKQNIDTQAYQEYFDYVEYCLEKARLEVYGG